MSTPDAQQRATGAIDCAPADAARLQPGDDDPVRLRSRHGETPASTSH